MHVPVLLQSTIEQLNLGLGETVLDATLGLGGHARAISERIGPDGTLIGLEADRRILAQAEINLQDCPSRLVLLLTNFRHLTEELEARGITSVNKVLFDLGLNSEQLALSGRGFSFQQDEPLLMTLVELGDGATNPESAILTAREIVNDWSEESLADIIYAYGEEPASRRIAKAIVSARAVRAIKTTFDLIEALEAGGLKRQGKIHPATRTFQALRIAVNDEIGALKDGLAGAWDKLITGGRLAVISFHSLEARLVKDFFLAKVKSGEGQLITKRVIRPTRNEILDNPRSRSAQLRVIKKI